MALKAIPVVLRTVGSPTFAGPTMPYVLVTAAGGAVAYDGPAMPLAQVTPARPMLPGPPTPVMVVTGRPVLPGKAIPIA